MTVAPTSGTPGRKPMSKEEKKALRKERKANRDPNAPKRPPSAYLLFQNEIREDMRQRYKDLTYSEVLGKISEAWKALTEEQRKVSIRSSHIKEAVLIPSLSSLVTRSTRTRPSRAWLDGIRRKRVTNLVGSYKVM